MLAGLWWVLRDRIGLRPERGRLPAMLRFGAPTVPAEVSVYALNVVDRFYLYHAASPGKAGLYSLAVKLATVVVLLTRALRFAWPPLAYSVADEREARRLYALVATYYVLLAGLVVAGATLLGRWVLKVFAASNFYAAFPALPWVALGWALYGVFVLLVVVAGRAQRTSRNFPAAFAGLVANVVLLVALVGPLGIAGAGIALCGAYVVMIVVMHLLTRRLFPVPFEWRRLAQVVVVTAAVTVAGEVLLPTSGAAAFFERTAALLAIPLLLAVTGFFDAAERSRLRALARRLRRGARPGEARGGLRGSSQFSGTRGAGDLRARRGYWAGDVAGERGSRQAGQRGTEQGRHRCCLAGLRARRHGSGSLEWSGSADCGRGDRGHARGLGPVDRGVR